MIAPAARQNSSRRAGVTAADAAVVGRRGSRGAAPAHLGTVRTDEVPGSLGSRGPARLARGGRPDRDGVGLDEPWDGLGVQLVGGVRRERHRGGEVLALGGHRHDVGDLRLARAGQRLELLADEVRDEVADERDDDGGTASPISTSLSESGRSSRSRRSRSRRTRAEESEHRRARRRPLRPVARPVEEVVHQVVLGVAALDHGPQVADVEDDAREDDRGQQDLEGDRVARGRRTPTLA